MILAVCILALIVTALIIKLVVLKRNMYSLATQYQKLLEEDTNALIRLSSSDGDLRKLCAVLESELERVRALRKRYLDGDKRVKEAVTNISHDLRTPLTAVNGYVELLEKSELSEEQRGWVKIIKRRTAELSALTEELFRYAVTASRELELDRTEVSINEALEECLLSFYATFKEKGIEPVSDICERKVIRTTDREALFRIFSNIVSNALKYAEKDFSVSLREDGLICFSNRAEALTKLDVERLFDRYYTVKNNSNATGLGLSIARLLSENLGFDIAATHQNGELKIVMKV